MGAMLALRICGGFFMLRAIMFTIYPDTLTTLLNYPPKSPVATGGFMGIGSTATVITDAEMKGVLQLTQFYGMVQGGIGGLALATSRVGDPYTMYVTALGLSLTVSTFIIFGYVALKDDPSIDQSVIQKMLVPSALVAMYLFYTGYRGIADAKKTGLNLIKQPIGKSGRALQFLTCASVVQSMPLIFAPDMWLSKFLPGMVMQPPTARLLTTLLPMWGISIMGVGLTRVAVVFAANTASVYAANRAAGIYFAQVVGALALSKTLSANDEKTMMIQTWVAFILFAVSYFGGTIADDAAKAKTP